MDILDIVKSKLSGRPTQDQMAQMAEHFWKDIFSCAYRHNHDECEQMPDPEKMHEMMALLRYNSVLTKITHGYINDYVLMDKAQKPLELAKQLENILKGLRDEQRDLKDCMDKHLEDD